LVHQQESQQLTTRIADGVEDVSLSSQQERDSLLTKFKDMVMSERMAQRRQGYMEAAKDALDSSVQTSDNDSAVSGSISTPGTPATITLAGSESLASPLWLQNADDDDVLQRELELAKQLALAEQRGYQRAMSERLKFI